MNYLVMYLLFINLICINLIAYNRQSYNYRVTVESISTQFQTLLPDNSTTPSLLIAINSRSPRNFMTLCITFSF